jgi:hypothetical protein
MADGRRKHDWQQTSSIIAKIHNVNVSKRSDLISPEDVDPTITKARQPMKISIKFLKGQFTKK